MSLSFWNYLGQARRIRFQSEQKWAGLKGFVMQGDTPEGDTPEGNSPEGDLSKPPEGPPPKPPVDRKDRKLEEQIKMLEDTIQKEREGRKVSEAEAKKAAQYRLALGELDPTRLDEINSALELQKKHETMLAQTKSEAAAERDRFYEAQLKELQAQNQLIQDQHNGLKKRLAIQRFFTQAEVNGRPSELDAFISLCGNQFDYDAIKDAIVKVKDAGGQEIFVGGKSATPVDLMLQMRQGKQGYAISSCFNPYNQSKGGGLPITGSDGQPIGDWKEMSKEQRAAIAFNKTSI
jgi:hypothetical protein